MFVRVFKLALALLLIISICIPAVSAEICMYYYSPTSSGKEMQLSYDSRTVRVFFDGLHYYEYDEYDRLVQKKPDYPRWYIQYFYDENGLLAAIDEYYYGNWDEDGNYDESMPMSWRKRSAIPQYNAEGLLERIDWPDGSYEIYDENGNVRQYVNSNGYADTYIYDEHGCIMERQYNSVPQEIYIYDEDHRLIRIDYAFGSAKEYEYFDDGSWKTSKDMSEYGYMDFTYFNADGSIQKSVTVWDDIGTYETLYEYDESGRLTKYENMHEGVLSEVRHFNSNGLLAKVEDFEYDVVKTFEYCADGITLYAVYTDYTSYIGSAIYYDERGRPVSEYDSDGEYYEYAYTDNDIVEFIDFYSADGELKNWEQCYTEPGLEGVVFRKGYDSDRRAYYEYTPDGLMVKQVLSDGRYAEVDYSSFNSDDCVIAKVYDKDGSLTKEIHLEYDFYNIITKIYDKDGNLIEEKHEEYDSDMTCYRTVYEWQAESASDGSDMHGEQNSESFLLWFAYGDEFVTIYNGY